MFKRKTPNQMTDLIVEYVNSLLPSGLMCRETIGDSDVRSILVFTDTKALNFEFDLSEGYKVKELSDGDKLHINRTVILPALKRLDKELFETHNQIKQKVEELEKL